MRHDVVTGDALAVLRELPAMAADCVMADLPYGTTRNKWDSVINLEAFWAECWRILPRCGSVICTAAQPFTSALIMSQLRWFRHDLVWEKSSATGFLNAKRAPLRAHESILVFCRTAAPYFPQKTAGHTAVHSFNKNCESTNYGKQRPVAGGGSTERYPRSVVRFAADKQRSAIHPTQKPVLLMRWLLMHYTLPGQTVLDPTCGSGTTGVACIQTGRNYIGVESDAVMAQKARDRITASLEGK